MMLSFSKILLLIAVIAAVFFIARWLRAAPRKPVARRAAGNALDLRKCGVCGVYVGEADGACGRPNCPAA